MKKIDSIISDEQIDAAWGNANFGTTPRKEVIAESLLKCATGYSTGHTAECICRELGLVFQSKWMLTSLGKEYLLWYYYRPVFSPTPEKEAFNAAREEEFKDRFGKWKYETFEDYLKHKNDSNDKH